VNVRYTRRAEDDLVEIGVYTLIEWGPEQRDKYLDLLEAACERIIPRNLKHARDVPGYEGLLRWRCERHVIVFRRVSDGIEIVRVLHERMLPSKHL